MTVLCAMRLVEEGPIQLDDPVSKYFPEYADAFLSEDGVRIPINREITVRQLFTMSAGLVYSMVVSPLVVEFVKKTEGKATAADVCRLFPRLPLKFQPNERFEYSVCHDVLGGLIEVVTGKRLSEYMRDNLFIPLEIDNLGFHRGNENVMQMYRYDSPVSYSPCPPNLRLFPCENYDSGGAGLMGGVDSLSKIAQAIACGGIYQNGFRFLKEETVKQIYEPQMGFQLEGTAMDNMYGKRYGYGLGVSVKLEDDEWEPTGTFGWSGAAGSLFQIDPKNQISLVIGRHLHACPNEVHGKFKAIAKALYEDLKDEGLL